MSSGAHGCCPKTDTKRIMALMKKLRFREVYNIADGIIAWKRRKYPLKRGADSD